MLPMEDYPSKMKDNISDIHHFITISHFPIEQRTGSSRCSEGQQAILSELNIYLKTP